jgi:NAD(P)-dependent dehydrogenase (short-subunit alcohol dehydrogenase family)
MITNDASPQQHPGQSRRDHRRRPALGKAFRRAGARVALGDIDTELVEKTAVELAEVTGGDVCGLALDVSSRKAFAAFLDNAEARLGPLDALANNAGNRAPRRVRPMTDVEPEDVAATVVAVVGSRRTKAVFRPDPA